MREEPKPKLKWTRHNDGTYRSEAGMICKDAVEEGWRFDGGWWPLLVRAKVAAEREYAKKQAFENPPNSKDIIHILINAGVCTPLLSEALKQCASCLAITPELAYELREFYRQQFTRGPL